MIGPTSLTVYLADDHRIVADGLASLLERSAAVAHVEVFTDGAFLVARCSIKRPDVVFLDLEMPGWDGRTCLLELRKRYPEVRCFMLSMINERYVIEDCIAKGAAGYLNKDCTADELNAALHHRSSEPFFSSAVQKVVSGNVIHANDAFRAEPLSEREHVVLVLLCEGLSPKEIAEKLFVSHRTVETHKTNIMKKIGVNSVGKLISTAIKHRIV